MSEQPNMGMIIVNTIKEAAKRFYYEGYHEAVSEGKCEPQPDDVVTALFEDTWEESETKEIFDDLKKMMADLKD